MSYAVMFPTTTANGKGFGSPKKTQDSPSKNMLYQARTILTHAPELQAEVLSKVIGLNAAYDIAKERKDETEKLTKDADEKADRLAVIQNADVELYNQVVKGTISIETATAELAQRESLREQGVKVSLASYAKFIDHSLSFAHSPDAIKFMKDINEARENEWAFTFAPRKEIINSFELLVEKLPLYIEALKK